MKAAVRFIRHGGIYRSDVSSHLPDQGRSAAFRTGPTPAKRTRRKFPRPTHRRDEFRPAIPQRGARQHCPSPLHRQPYPKSVPGSGTMNLQRTVYSVLTLCLSQGDNPTLDRSIVNREEFQCLLVIDPHRLGVVVEQETIAMLGILQRLLGASLGRHVASDAGGAVKHSLRIPDR